MSEGSSDAKPIALSLHRSRGLDSRGRKGVLHVQRGVPLAFSTSLFFG